MPGISNLTKHIQGVRTYQITPESEAGRVFWAGGISSAEDMVVPTQTEAQNAIVSFYNTGEILPENNDILLFGQLYYRVFTMPDGVPELNLTSIFLIPLFLNEEENAFADPQPIENLNTADFIAANIGPNRLY